MLIKVVLGHEIRIKPPRLLPFIKILPHTEQFSKENNFVDEISQEKKILYAQCDNVEPTVE